MSPPRRHLTALGVAVLFAVSIPAPAFAFQVDDEPAAPIAAEVDPRRDVVIERGLGQRFAQIEGLGEVEVSVTAGVVRLSGSTLSLAASEEAVAIARRTEGVVEVIDEIEVVRDLDRRLAPALESLKDRFVGFVGWLPLAGVALVIFLAFFFLGRWLVRWDAPFRRLSHNVFVQELARQAVRAAMVIVGVLLALEILDATALVGAVLGTAGVFGLAVGFAFRDLAENYISSILLSLRQPFAPGDLVEIDDRKGKVVRLTSRATILMTLDGNHLRIPNAQVFKGVILNYTRNPLRRFDFIAGVGTAEDLVRAQRLGVELLAEMEGVVDDPPPASEVEALGDSNVSVRFFGWVDQAEASYTKVRSEAIRRLKVAFDDAGVEMPEPIYRLRTEPFGEPPKPAAAAPDRRPEPEPEAEPAVADLTAGDDIDRQIADERAASHEEDLLAAEAPKE